MEDGSAKISSPAQAIMYPPDAAASSTKLKTGTFFSSASTRTRLWMRCDCAGEPPGEFTTSATARRPGAAKARSSIGATLAIERPDLKGRAAPIAPDRRTAVTSGALVRIAPGEEGTERFGQSVEKRHGAHVIAGF